MSDLVNRNAEAMKKALEMYRQQTEDTAKKVDSLHGTISGLLNRVAILETQVAMLRIQRLGNGPTE